MEEQELLAEGLPAEGMPPQLFEVRPGLPPLPAATLALPPLAAPVGPPRHSLPLVPPGPPRPRWTPPCRRWRR